MSDVEPFNASDALHKTILL